MSIATAITLKTDTKNGNVSATPEFLGKMIFLNSVSLNEIINYGYGNRQLEADDTYRVVPRVLSDKQTLS